MKQFITHITVVVTNYDEAIQFYTEKLNFDLVEDTLINEIKGGFW
ncbi:VOC family protein [Mucilaginibacter sp. cycad4]|nr:VOC family protein [Mucilaginibacter gossypii]WPU98739.1 VOC family protein [Mucilaginibacter gossypii]